MGFKKEDIEYHYDSGRSRPAVNVKVYGRIQDVKLPFCTGVMKDVGETEFKEYYSDPEFTHEWIEEHLTDEDLNSHFDWACQWNWEWLNDEAERIFGPGYKVYSEGRSGGWAVVHPITKSDVEDWDAIDLNKWRAFVKSAKAAAKDIPRAMVEDIYHNDFEQWDQERRSGSVKVVF